MKNLKSKTTKSRDEIPDNFDSCEAAAEFWDTHDVSDYLDLTEEVTDVHIKLKRKHFKIEPDITAKLSKKNREKEFPPKRSSISGCKKSCSNQKNFNSNYALLFYLMTIILLS